MARDQDRRGDIAGAAIAIIAEDGLRALTHRAVDRRLGLPLGSTSFYARNRRALLTAAARELAVRARRVFSESGMGTPEVVPDLGEVTTAIAGFLERMLVEHRQDIVARYALALEVRDDPELHELLAVATFSRPLAETLMSALGVVDPEPAAAGLISLTEGLLLDRTIGQRSLPQGPGPGISAREQDRDTVHHYLRGLPRS